MFSMFLTLTLCANCCHFCCTVKMFATTPRYKGMTPQELKQKNITIDAWNPPLGDMFLDPNTRKGMKIVPNCANPTMKPTICDPKLRTMNTQASI